MNEATHEVEEEESDVGMSDETIADTAVDGVVDEETVEMSEVETFEVNDI